MKQHVFDFSSAHEHGPVFWDFLKLRKTYFVDELGWDIPHNDAVEMDQYDTPLAFYAVVTHRGRVVAGARCMPTSACWGRAGYMLGDARLGRIEGIPATIVPSGLTGPKILEATRLVIEQSLTVQQRARCLEMLVDSVVGEARARGVLRLVALSHLSLARKVRALGYQPVQCGPTYLDPSSGKRHAVLSMHPWKVGQSQRLAQTDAA